ncbi:MAG: type II secretion system minor pseudopilin GspI [Thiotrichaceae bacterium]
MYTIRSAGRAGGTGNCGSGIEATQQQVDNIGYLRDQTIAHWVASNLLNDTLLRPTMAAVGKTRRQVQMLTRYWFWTLEVSDTMDKGLRRLDVQVRITETTDTEPLAFWLGLSRKLLSRHAVNNASISRKCLSKNNDNIEEIVNKVSNTLRLESASLAERMRSQKLKFTVWVSLKY